MDIKEAIKLKYEMDLIINSTIKNFQQETGLEVDAIFTITVGEMVSPEPNPKYFHTEIKFPKYG